MNNPNDRYNKDFVMHRSDEADEAIDDYKNEGHESSNESYRKWLSMPLIFGAVGFLILNIIITVFISSSTDSTGSEQIPRIEIRLDRMETKLTSISEDIERLKSVKRKIVNQNTSKSKKTSSAQKSQTGLKPKIYKVQSGDTLSKIGQQYGLSVKQLRDYNSLESNALIHPGQKLKLVP